MRFFQRKNYNTGAKLDMDGELCNGAGEIFDAAEVTNVHYTASWILSSIPHIACRSQLDSEESVSKAVRTLSSMKTGSDRVTAGVQLTKFLSMIVNTFKNNFSSILENSTIGVREKMFTIIKSSAVKNFLCEECYSKIIAKYLNVLIKAKLNEMNQTFKDKQIRNKNRSTTQKAYKLDIVPN